MSVLVHKRHVGDTLKLLLVTMVYENEDGEVVPLDLTDAIAGSVKFKMINKATAKKVVDLTATGVTFSTDTTGEAQYDFLNASTLKAGIYYGYFVYTDTAETDHYPFQTGDLVIEIDSDTVSAQEAYQKAVEIGGLTTVESEVTCSFPESLIIGDSYTENTGQIKINISYSTGLPITEFGELLLEDADISFVAFRPNDSAVITGICEFVDDTTETYILVTLPASETSLGLAEYTYEGRLKFFWEGPSTGNSDDEQKTFKTTPFKFIANP